MATCRWLAVALVAAGLAASAGCKTSLEYYKDGVHALEAKQYDDAIKSFNGAIEKDPESDLSYANRGDAFLAKQDWDAALKDYDRAIALNEPREGAGPSMPNPWFFNRRGLTYYYLKQYDKALADWKKAKDLEDRRAAKGLKVRKSDEYVKMLEVREGLLPETERQAATMPTMPGPGGEPLAAAPPTPAPEPIVAAPPPTADQKMEEELARLRAEEARRKAQLTATPTPSTDADEAQAVAEAQKAREAAAAERARREMATATPPPPAPAPVEPVLPPRPPPPPPPPGPAPVATPAPSDATPAARSEKSKHVASLTGTWTCDNGLVFNFVDDGLRVVGEAAGSDLYVYYEVTLQWKDDHTLAGFGTLKENVDQCKFETSAAWSFDVVDATHAKSKIEEVAWNDQCQEVDRAPLEHTFEKKK